MRLAVAARGHERASHRSAGSSRKPAAAGLRLGPGLFSLRRGGAGRARSVGGGLAVGGVGADGVTASARRELVRLPLSDARGRSAAVRLAGGLRARLVGSRATAGSPG